MNRYLRSAVLSLAVGALIVGAASASGRDGPAPPANREPVPRPHPDRGYLMERPQAVHAGPLHQAS